MHPDDPTLSDKQWEQIAERLMKATGIHQAGARWIAVRHADDHIHLVATLVSERTGKRIYPDRDWPKLRAECRKIERELGLVATAGADKTALPAPTRREKGKAERKGWAMTAREELRRVVSQCAASTSSDEEFLRQLRREGLNPKTTVGADGEVRGYTVSRPGDVTADGTPVTYSGTKLAADLTWPKLMARWASTPTAAPVERTEDGRVSRTERHDALEHAAAVVERATEQIRDGGGDVDGIAHATGEVLTTLARGREGRELGPLAEIAERYDRAARTPHRVLPARIGPVARDLRQASRRIAAAGALSGRGKEKFAGIALLLALASLVAEIAAWQQMRGRVHQAAAARRAARALPGLAQPPGGGRPPAAARPVTPPTAGGTQGRPHDQGLPPAAAERVSNGRHRMAIDHEPGQKRPARRVDHNPHETHDDRRGYVRRS
ncbi:relaxase/mobilization nuclease domain-containing protein [Amycolatopsis sp. NPDC023774]|uniref:relaxase/mobilization nuclease domain-containing protein n=1 Tax=Amycolatopsis sp. NPDC023774 TaxID=3155015 RepID=UPI0034068BA8